MLRQFIIQNYFFAGASNGQIFEVAYYFFALAGGTMPHNLRYTIIWP